MNNAPLVSVIIPTFKRSEFLTRAIQSVLDQTYSEIEIIIVDDNDGNNEFRLQTKAELRANFPTYTFTYIEHEVNQGLATARNSGIKVAKGAYLAFLDDDDVWYNDKIAKQVALFGKLDDSYGVVASYWKIIDVQNQVETIRKLKYKGDLSKILGLNHFAPPSMVMVSRKYLEVVGGFDDNFRWRQDIELYYRMAFHCKFDYVEEVLVDYYKHADQMSTNFEKKLIHVKMFIEKHHSTLWKQKLPWSELQEHLGELYALNNMKWLATRAFVEAYRFRPKRMKILMKLLLSLSGSKKFRAVRKK